MDLFLIQIKLLVLDLNKIKSLMSLKKFSFNVIKKDGFARLRKNTNTQG